MWDLPKGKQPEGTIENEKKMKKISESDLMRSDKTLLHTYRKE